MKRSILLSATIAFIFLVSVSGLTASVSANGSVPTGQTIPYFQSFEGISLPSGWSGTMEVLQMHGIGGSNALSFNLFEPGATSCNGISPEILLTSNPCQLNFHYRLVNWSNYPGSAAIPGPGDKVEVQLSYNSGLTYTTIYTIDQGNHIVGTDYAQQTVSLGSGPGNVVIRFQCTWGSGDYFVDIDDFLVEEVPQCPPPSSLQSTNITATSFSVSWNSAANVDIEYGYPGHTPGSGTIIPGVTLNPFTIQGLSAMTTYDVYLRQDCGQGLYSSWAGPLTVTTTDELTSTLTAINNPGGTGYVSNMTFTKSGPAIQVSTFLNDTSGRGFIKFDISSIPANAIFTRAAIRYFNYFRESTSGSLNYIYPLASDPVITPGPALYNDCGDGTILWQGIWDGGVPGWIESELNTDALSYLSSNAGDGWAGFGIVRGSVSQYNFHGYDDAVNKPQLILEYHLPSEPLLSVVPSGVDFGQHHLGFQSATQQFLISNSGTDTLEISKVSLTGSDSAHFVFTDGNSYPQLLTTGESISVSTVFSPQTTGLKLASLLVTANGEDHYYPVTGEGYLSPPLNVTATPLVNSKVELTWQIPLWPAPAASFTGYAVHRGTSPNLYTDHFTGITSTSFADTTTTPSTGYYYSVSAEYTYGQAFSGEISVTTYSGCPIPTELSALNITVSSATIQWNGNGSNTWELEWGPAGFAPGTGIYITTSVSNPYLITGLAPGQGYDCYVRSNCGNGIFSNWSGPVNFTTLCPLYDAPFTEDFESTDFPPECWSLSAGSPAWTRSFTVSGYGTGSGSALAGFQQISDPTPFSLFTFSFSQGSLALPQLMFDYAYATFNSEIDSLLIYSSIDNGNSYTLLAALAGGANGILNTGGMVSVPFVPNASQWKPFAITLPAGTNRISFTARSAWGNNLYIDNVKVIESILPMSLAATVTDALCNNMPSGSIDLEVAGGLQPYSYLWSTGATTQDIDGLYEGDYSVTVTDALNSVTDSIWSVSEPGEISFIGNSTPVSCYGFSDGMLEVTIVEGGTPPYSYLWSTGSTNAAITGLAAGTYYLTIADSHACHVNGFALVGSPGLLSSDAVITPASCPQTNDGSIDLTVAGGTEPFTYLWSNGSTSEDLTGLQAGEYTVTVTDFNNCNHSAMYSVTNASGVCPTLSVAGTVNTVVCYNATQVIEVAGPSQSFVVQSGGRATFIAGQKIRYLQGTRVLTGGYMRGYIAPGGPWCNAKSLTENMDLTTQEDGISNQTGGFILYPNPAHNQFTIKNRAGVVMQRVGCTILDMQGNKILEKQEMETGSMVVETIDLVPGIYFVRIVTESETSILKVIKTER